MQRIKVLLLDADGVIQIPHSEWRGSIAKFCGGEEYIGSFLEEIFSVESPCLEGKSDFVNDIEKLFDKKGWQGRLDRFLNIWTMISPIDEILTLVTALQASNKIVALASNQEEYRAKYMSERLNYRNVFNDLFFSYSLGVAKPGGDYFSRIADYYNLTSEEMLFIDDNISNVESAKARGLNAELFHAREGVEQLKNILNKYAVFTS